MTKHPLQPDPGYYTNYILKVPQGDICTIMENQHLVTNNLLLSIPEEKGNFAYATGKWTVKELIGHMIDAERVFAYRAMRFSRNDKTPLPSFEEDEYVKNAFFNESTVINLAEQFSLLRLSTIAQSKSLNNIELKRTGIASGKELSVEQLLYIIAGHELHHVEVLKERYDIGK
jgi:DinB superfamily